MPEVPPTTEIEDAINELYTFGFQATGDVANALFHSHVELGEFTFKVTPEVTNRPIVGLSDDEDLAHLAWQVVQKRVRT